jgi:hypothetical protein
MVVCMVNATPRPLYPRGIDPVPIIQEPGWATQPVWLGGENLASTSQDRQARSESLYWLLYKTEVIVLLLVVVVVVVVVE